MGYRDHLGIMQEMIHITHIILRRRSDVELHRSGIEFMLISSASSSWFWRKRVFPAIHIYTAGDAASLIILAIPNQLVASCGIHFVCQGFHHLTFDVVDGDLHVAGILGGKADGCFRVEGVGIVSLQHGGDGCGRVVV